MDEAEMCISNLPDAAFAAQLLDHLMEVKQRARHPGMREGKKAAVGVDRYFAAIGHLPIGDKRPAFTLPTEAEVLQHHYECPGETVIDAGEVHVLSAVACHRVRSLTGFNRARGRERGHQE